MNKINLFFCDIMGTLEGNKTNEDIDFKQFNENLNNISNENKTIFSLISSDNYDYVKNYYEQLKRYFNGNVSLGKQFYNRGEFSEESNNSTNLISKVDQISSYKEELENKRYEIDKIYYVEDTTYNQMLLTAIADVWGIEIINITPIKNDGLKEINYLLNKYIDSTKQTKTK